jgi:copper(I)-binding protein
MRHKTILLCTIGLVFGVSPPLAAAESVKVTRAWVRAPAPGQNTAGGYVELTSDRNLAIVSAGSPAAARVEVHATTVDGGVMRMRPVSQLELPAGRTVKLAPGGTHLMLIDLKRPLKTGEKLPITLSLQPSGGGGSSLTTISFEAEVRSASSSAHNH